MGFFPLVDFCRILKKITECVKKDEDIPKFHLIYRVFSLFVNSSLDYMSKFCI